MGTLPQIPVVPNIVLMSTRRSPLMLSTPVFMKWISSGISSSNVRRGSLLKSTSPVIA